MIKQWTQRALTMYTAIRFLFRSTPSLSLKNKVFLLLEFFRISRSVECKHTNAEMITMAESIAMIPSDLAGVIVEAGAYKGGSTAKLSLVARIVGRRLIVFDSFQGIPRNTELLSNFGKKNLFVIPKGMFTGSLQEVKKTIRAYGAPGVCTFFKGWFDKTMPKFHVPVVAIFLDVDLASSERTCLKYLYPLLRPGGILYSHDGHIDLVVKLYKNRRFWNNELHINPPVVEGLGKQKLLCVRKTHSV